MKVYAEFVEEDGLIFRKKTLLQFGNSVELIGSAILMNPGQSQPNKEINFDKEIIKQFYKQNHNLEEDTDQWYSYTTDSTMGQLRKIFDGWYTGQNKQLNGIIQLFNCFYFKDQNLNNALKNFSSDSKFLFDEHDLLINKPVYFGWGNVGKDGLFREIAENIFNKYDHSQTPIYDKDFEKNCFYHPGYVNRSYAKNIKTKKITTDFFELISSNDN